MKIKIDKNGYLEIERAGIMKSQYCPGFDDIHCGDHCPLFGESEKSELMELNLIQLCHNKILVGEIIDERVKP